MKIIPQLPEDILRKKLDKRLCNEIKDAINMLPAGPNRTGYIDGLNRAIDFLRSADAYAHFYRCTICDYEFERKHHECPVCLTISEEETEETDVSPMESEDV